MKRNETILVYAVTVMLLVILLVAVVFGESKPAKAGVKSDNTPVAKIPGVDELFESVEKDDEDKVEAPKKDDPKVDPKADEKGDPAKEVKKPTPPVDPKQDEAKKEGGPVDLSAKVPLTPEKQLELELGTSTLVGENYRKVKSLRGDTLRRVVARWCGGDSADHLADAEAMNEALVGTQLSAGQEVLVPKVDAEAILAARSAPRAAKGQAAPVKKAGPVVAAKAVKYTLKKGDSLWALAKSRVGENRFVPAWIERFKQLNPEITDVSVLVAGQRVNLPK